MLPNVRADMIQGQEEETAGSHKVQKQFNGNSKDENLTQSREVKEVTSGINIYLESITPLLGVEATTEEDKKVGKRCWYKGGKKKVAGEVGRDGWKGE